MVGNTVSCSTWDVFWPASNKGGTARALPRTRASEKMPRSKSYCLQASYQSGKHAAPRPDPRGSHRHKAPRVAERSAAVAITGRREVLRLTRRYCARADIVAQRGQQQAAMVESRRNAAGSGAQSKRHRSAAVACEPQCGSHSARSERALSALLEGTGKAGGAAVRVQARVAAQGSTVTGHCEEAGTL